MGLISQNRFKNLSPEYVEEQVRLAAEAANVAQDSNEGSKETPEAQADKKVIGDTGEQPTTSQSATSGNNNNNSVSEAEEAKSDDDKESDDAVSEAAYIDMLLEALDE